MNFKREFVKAVTVQHLFKDFEYVPSPIKSSTLKSIFSAFKFNLKLFGYLHFSTFYNNNSRYKLATFPVKSLNKKLI